MFGIALLQLFVFTVLHSWTRYSESSFTMGFADNSVFYWYSHICYTGLTGSQLWHMLYSHICYTGLTGSQLWHTLHTYIFCVDTMCRVVPKQFPAMFDAFILISIFAGWLHWDHLPSSGLILQLTCTYMVFITLWRCKLYFIRCPMFDELRTPQPSAD